MTLKRRFEDYRTEIDEWVTIIPTEFYPDVVENAKVKYQGVMEAFSELVEQATDSTDLLRRIMTLPPNRILPNEEKQPIRSILLQVFRRYVSPISDHEWLKKVSETENVIAAHGDAFRPLEDVRENLRTRPMPDEVIISLLYEYSTRGKKGYDLTEAFFDWFEERFGEDYTITGPRRAGKDVLLHEELPGYTKRTPVDFLIRRKRDNTAVAVGLARYDATRGGAQGGDRTGGNRDKARDITGYAIERNIPLKVIYLNDGPGLRHNDVWAGSIILEKEGRGRILVSTLKMLDHRLTKQWLES